jgi:hypothetical protein
MRACGQGVRPARGARRHGTTADGSPELASHMTLMTYNADRRHSKPNIERKSGIGQGCGEGRRAGHVAGHGHSAY